MKEEKLISAIEKLSESVNDLKEYILSTREGGTGSGQPKNPEASIPGKKRISVREFLKETNPKSAVQKTLVFGYFIENHNDIDSFTTKDIELMYKKAKEIAPSNISDTLYQNAKKGYVMEIEAKEKGQIKWTLTNAGEVEVQKYVSKNQ